MKNFTFTLAFAAIAVSSAAQESTPPSKFSVETNSFGSNWFVDLGLGYNASYTSQERGVTANPFSHKRGALGMNAAIGKWFAPEIGLRLAGEYGWAKNTTRNWHGSHPAVGYMHIHGDVMLNATNIFSGYDDARFWNMIPYAGVGFIRNFDDNQNALAISLGVRNTFKLTDRLDAFSEVQMVVTKSIFLGPKGNNGSNILAFNHYDKIANIKVGVSYDLSRNNKWRESTNLVEVVMLNQEQIDFMDRMITEEQAENERLRQLLAESRAAKSQTPRTVVTTKVVTNTEILTTPLSVFFKIDSDHVANQRDLVDLKDVANFAKQHNKQLMVTGYADSKTGSAAFNQALSEKRAESVVKELVRMGFPKERITIKAAGGVDALTPNSYNRRVTVFIQ
jgi:outer membrane protein OmpA-like peptidoglycan-associated protein